MVCGQTTVSTAAVAKHVQAPIAHLAICAGGVQVLQGETIAYAWCQVIHTLVGPKTLNTH